MAGIALRNIEGGANDIYKSGNPFSSNDFAKTKTKTNGQLFTAEAHQMYVREDTTLTSVTFVDDTVSTRNYMTETLIQGDVIVFEQGVKEIVVATGSVSVYAAAKKSR